MRLPFLLFLLLISGSPAFGQQKKPVPQVRPFVLGVVDELQSTVLSEKRILNIYLPDGYANDDTTRYPVIYLLDGSADEDFIHVVGLVQFSSFPWVHRVPKSIVVGIANTDRKRDFTFPSTQTGDRDLAPTSGGSGRFMAFIEKELQPFIDRKYRTSGTRTLIGESLGGLLATEILLKQPQLFDKYVIISPSLWWDDGSLLRQSSDLLTETFVRPTNVYIGVGKEGLTPGKTPHVMEVDANLLAERIRSGKSKSVTLHFDYLPQEDHATIAHLALYNAFCVLFPELREPTK